LLFQVSVSKISSVLLLNAVPLFSSVPKLHFQINIKCELCVSLSHIMDYLHTYYDKHIHKRVKVSQGYG